MFKIKICGITTPEDALLAADAGADAIGLNFYEKSPRYVSLNIAHEIDTALGIQTARAGVFVNADHFRICQCSAQASAAYVQFHGDESPKDVVEWRKELDFYSETLAQAQHKEPWFAKWMRAFTGVSKPVKFKLIRAIRHVGDLDDVYSYLRSCEQLGGLPHAILLDAHNPGTYGGTGQKLDWKVVRDERDKLLGLPLILAGGLTPENVAQAIATARPDAVDVASGVESSPGKKDPAKVRDFVAASKEAFARLERENRG